MRTTASFGRMVDTWKRSEPIMHRVPMSMVLVALLTLVTVDGEAQSAETYTYPGTDASTQYTIGNFNAQPVGVTTSFFDGSTGESTQHVVVLASGTQTRFTAESIGLDSFDGSTVITADLPVAVTASIFASEDSFEHMTPADSAVELVFPLGGVAGSQIEMAIFNPGTVQASARVILVDEAGTALNFSDRTVDPNGTESVAFTPDQNARYAVIRTSNFFLGGRPVNVAAFVRNFQPLDGAGGPRVDVAVVRGLPALAEPSSTRLPFFRQGGGFFSLIQVINDSTAPQSITLTAVGLDGQPLAGGNNPATITVGGESSLAGRAVHTESFKNLFDISDVQLKTGSILVEGSARLSSAVAVGSVANGDLAILPADATVVQDFAYQTRQVGREFIYRFSLTNPSGGPATVDMTFLLDDGTVVSSVTTTIEAGAQLVAPLASLLPEALGDGAVIFHSDVPLIASGLESRRDNRAASVLPVLPAAPDFMVGNPTELFAVGTVRSNGVGLSGVTVTLTGTESGTALTDAAGTFKFDDLSVGSYSLAAEAIGYALTPSSRSFSIATASSRDNDFVASLIVPSITNVTPGAAPVGSGETEIAVEGGPFIASSVVVLGTTQLPTSVVSSQLVLATIPTSLLQAPLQLNLVVRNVGLAGDFVASAPVTFTVGTAPPTLLALSGQPEPLIAGSPGFTLTVLGAGFIPGATVSVDGVFRNALFISDGELQADVSAGELAAGGFLPVTALNPGPAVPSNALNLVVLNPPPTVTAITPDTTEVRLSPTLPPLTLTVTGTGFQDGASVLLDAAPVPTVFVSDTTLTASLPASLLSISGVHDIQVSNPDPSVGPSFAFPLTLTNPVPVLTSVVGSPVYDPAQSGADQPVPILLQGSQFVENSTVWANLSCDALGFRLLPNIAVPSGQTLPPQLETRRLSPNTMTATVNVQCAGTYQFQVRSPQPGGGTSATVIVNVP